MGLSPLGVRAKFQSFIESAIGGNLVHESGRCYGEAGLLCETNCLGKRVGHFYSRKCSVTAYFKIVLRNRYA